MNRGVEQQQLAWLITKRSWVRIPSPLPKSTEGVRPVKFAGGKGMAFGTCERDLNEGNAGQSAWLSLPYPAIEAALWNHQGRVSVPG